MKSIEKMVEMAEKELEAIAGNGKFHGPSEVKYVGDLVDIVKDGYCIMDMEDGGSDDASYYDGGSYRGGMSRRGGGSYQRRDSMGRYSRTDGDGRGSYERGYSRDHADFEKRLRQMADEAPDDATRMSIHRMLEDMR